MFKRKMHRRKIPKEHFTHGYVIQIQCCLDGKSIDSGGYRVDNDEDNILLCELLFDKYGINYPLYLKHKKRQTLDWQ